MPTRAEARAYAMSRVGTIDYYGDSTWRIVYPQLVHTANGGRKSNYCAGFACEVDIKTDVAEDARLDPGIPGALWVPSVNVDNPHVSADRVQCMDNTIFDWNDDRLSDHIGFFDAWYNAKRTLFWSIEGNTSRNGDGTDIGYWRRLRSIDDVQSFIDRSAAFSGPAPTPPKPKPVAELWTAGPRVVTALQDHFKSPGRHDGYFDSQPSGNVGSWPRDRWTTIRWVSPGSARGSVGVKAMQRGLGVTADGLLGPATARAMQRWAGATQDGIAGTKTIQAVCRKLGIH